MSGQIPRPEHPRPDFRRDTFYNLNGAWQFAFDDDDRGLRETWYRPEHELAMTITVPFCYQCAASGIGPTDEIHPILWYRRTFTVPEELRGGRVLLRFGAVDWEARVYVNGRQAGGHAGGYTPFTVDATDYVRPGENDLCLRVTDFPDRTKPRGKQYWDRGLMGCWYTPVSGIWQTVYMEEAGEVRVETLRVTPDIDTGRAVAKLTLNETLGADVRVALTVSMNGEICAAVHAAAEGRHVRAELDVSRFLRLWEPDDPALYDLRAEIFSGDRRIDAVSTYFGMRKVETVNGQVLLNRHPLYQRLVLDQGYWPDTLLTPPSDEAIRADIAWTKRLGFNGARKHQKVEDPRYYYWADKMGLLVWGEVPSAYDFSDETVENLARLTLEFIRRDYNHPSLIVWTVLNESWGVSDIGTNPAQQAAANALFYLTKAADGTRLCSGNDGWEQTVTDLLTAHDYSATGAEMTAHLQDRTGTETVDAGRRPLWAAGWRLRGDEAFLVTEYGGIAFASRGAQGRIGGVETWGYNDKVPDEETFFRRVREQTEALKALPGCRGFCYTQLTDVMQEVNGLLTPDRRPKADPDRMREIFAG